MPNYSEKYYNEKFAYCSEAKKMVIGIPKGFDTQSDDMKLIFDYSLICIDIPEYQSKLFKMSKEKRDTIRIAVNNLIKKNKGKIYMGKNLEAVINYIFSRTNKSIAQLLKEIFKIDYHTTDSYSGESSITKEIATLEKMFSTVKFNQISKIRSAYICSYFLISPSFAETGKGSIYIMKQDLSKEDYIKIDEIYNKYLKSIYDDLINEDNKKINVDTVFDIEHILNDVLDLKGKYEKWDLKTFYEYIHFDKDYSGLILAMMNS